MDQEQVIQEISKAGPPIMVDSFAVQPLFGKATKDDKEHRDTTYILNAFSGNKLVGRYLITQSHLINLGRVLTINAETGLTFIETGTLPESNVNPETTDTSKTMYM